LGWRFQPAVARFGVRFSISGNMFRSGDASARYWAPEAAVNVVHDPVLVVSSAPAKIKSVE
jgi:hypothetical protein